MNIIDTIDNALEDWRTSPDAMRWSPDAATIAPTLPRFDATPILEALRLAAKAMARDIQAMAGQMRTFQRRVHPALVKMNAIENHEIARCRTCSPRANPPSLAINGHEYHRRSRKR